MILSIERMEFFHSWKYFTISPAFNLIIMIFSFMFPMNLILHSHPGSTVLLDDVPCRRPVFDAGTNQNLVRKSS